MPFCPDPTAPKLNGEGTPPPADVEGVTGVKTNWVGLGFVVSVVAVVVVAVPEVLGKLKENVGLSVAGVGVGVDAVTVVVAGNALTGVVVAPNTLPFLKGLGPGLETSCLGAAKEKTPGEVPVVTGVVEGKATFWSDPAAGLFPGKANTD